MRNPIDLFGAAWTLVTGHLKIFTLVAIATSAVITGSTAALGISPAGPEAQGIPTTPEFAFVLISIVAGMLANIAIMKAVSNPAEATFGGIFRFAVDKFLPYLWVSILVGASVLAGTILLIIPGIFLAVALSFATYALIFEGIGGTAALKKSYGYVKGRWFGVFGRYLFLILIGIILSAVIGFVSIGASSSLLGAFVVGFLSMLITAISVAYLYFMYMDIRSSSSAPTAPAMPAPEAPHETPQG